jgi:NAD(P)-dependent dehydrogenase (short-subunit alcohol dehydrogenase family)
MEFQGKIIIVTGGAQGIGRAIAESFKREGAKVFVLDIQEPDFEVEFLQADVSKESEIAQAIQNIERLDVLVNNAGIYFQASVEDTRQEDLDKMMDIDFKGPYLVSKHALPLLRNSKGNIINISSGLGMVPEPESPAYCSAKAAVNMLTKCMAQQYARESIRVNAILPGPIDTPLLRNALKTEKAFREYECLNPTGRAGSPEEVARVALFLASDEARYITGGMYAVDGGESSSSLYSLA